MCYLSCELDDKLYRRLQNESFPISESIKPFNYTTCDLNFYKFLAKRANVSLSANNEKYKYIVISNPDETDSSILRRNFYLDKNTYNLIKSGKIPITFSRFCKIINDNLPELSENEITTVSELLSSTERDCQNLAFQFTYGYKIKNPSMIVNLINVYWQIMRSPYLKIESQDFYNLHTYSIYLKNLTYN